MMIWSLKWNASHLVIGFSRSGFSHAGFVALSVMITWPWITRGNSNSIFNSTRAKKSILFCWKISIFCNQNQQKCWNFCSFCWSTNDDYLNLLICWNLGHQVIVSITMPGYVLEFSKYWVKSASSSSYWIRASEWRPRDSYKIAISSCNMKKLQKLQLGLFRASRSLSDWKFLLWISRFEKFENSCDLENVQYKLYFKVIKLLLSDHSQQYLK